jgi:ABC-type Fe3+ transport system substrate-binding protein
LFASLQSCFLLQKKQDDSTTDKLIVISPHRKSIQNEFIPEFRKHYEMTYGKKVKVEWLDQGGTSDDVRFIRAKFKNNPATSGVDLFWGGGDTAFNDLKADGILEKYELPAELKKHLPAKAAGVALHDKDGTWFGTAISSFGLFFNRKLLKKLNLPEPKVWGDLASPQYKGHISVTDPRRSGSFATMNYIVLQSNGWQKGWEILHGIGANSKGFAHSSSDPIKNVVAGAARIAMAIDFYATSKIADLGEENVGFTLPAKQTVLNPDPVGILKGAPNRIVAERFINFILSASPQKLFVLPKGANGGPKLASLGRMSVNKSVYDKTDGKRITEFNPHTLQAMQTVDTARASRVRKILNDLVGVLLVDTHVDLEKAWKNIIKKGFKPSDIKAFTKMPISESELENYASKWDDQVFRNQKINEWTKFAKAKYSRLSEQ